MVKEWQLVSMQHRTISAATETSATSTLMKYYTIDDDDDAKEFHILILESDMFWGCI